MKKISTLIISSLLFFLCFVTANAAIAQNQPIDSNNPVIEEYTNLTKNTNEITVKSYGNSEASTFYFRTTRSVTPSVYYGKTRNFEYDLSLKNKYQASGLSILSAQSWMLNEKNQLEGFSLTGNSGYDKSFDFKTIDDTNIAHDNLGNFYLLNVIETSFVSPGELYGYDIDAQSRTQYELVPIAQDITFQIGDISFSNLDEINQKGNFILESSNTYKPIFDKVKSEIKSDFKTLSGYEPEGIIPFDDIATHSFAICSNQSVTSPMYFSYTMGKLTHEYANGKVNYYLPVSIEYKESPLSIYQDGDKTGSHDYTIDIPSKASGKLKVYYKDNNGNVVSTKTVNVLNGNFTISIPTGQFAVFYIAQEESLVNSTRVQIADTSGEDIYFGHSDDVVGVPLASEDYQQYVINGNNNYHDFLLKCIEQEKLTKNTLTAYIYHDEWGSNNRLYVYNVARDGKITIDAANNISPIVDVTGNIELSDKSITYKSNYFDIKNGSGTFTAKSNQKISLTSLPRNITYKISNVQAGDYNVNITNASGGINTTAKITLSKSGQTPSTPPATNTGSIVIKTNSNKSVPITGKIELSDKSVNYSSGNFNITNGKGTFNFNSNQSITLNSLPSDTTYKITDVNAGNYGILISNSSGSVNAIVTISLIEQTPDVARDGYIIIDAINTSISPVVKITGNIKLSDKSINFSSNNFNIVNGEGTFNVNSNQKLTLKSLPNNATYTISNVKASNTTVSVTNASGSVNKTVKITLSKASTVKPSTPSPAKPAQITPTINIKLKSFKAKSAKSKFTAKWSKVSTKNRKKITKIQVQYSANSNFSNAKTYNVSKNSKSKTIKKLKKGTYYVRARVIQGNAVGSWTSVKKVKVK